MQRVLVVEILIDFFDNLVARGYVGFPHEQKETCHLLQLFLVTNKLHNLLYDWTEIWAPEDI